VAGCREPILDRTLAIKRLSFQTLPVAKDGLIRFIAKQRPECACLIDESSPMTEKPMSISRGGL